MMIIDGTQAESVCNIVNDTHEIFEKLWLRYLCLKSCSPARLSIPIVTIFQRVVTFDNQN